MACKFETECRVGQLLLGECNGFLERRQAFVDTREHLGACPEQRDQSGCILLGSIQWLEHTRSFELQARDGDELFERLTAHSVLWVYFQGPLEGVDCTAGIAEELDPQLPETSQGGRSVVAGLELGVRLQGLCQSLVVFQLFE